MKKIYRKSIIATFSMNFIFYYLITIQDLYFCQLIINKIEKLKKNLDFYALILIKKTLTFIYF